jgi:hypothetical protein
MLGPDCHRFDDTFLFLSVDLKLKLISNASDADCAISSSQNSFHNPEANAWMGLFLLRDVSSRVREPD